MRINSFILIISRGINSNKLKVHFLKMFIYLAGNVELEHWELEHVELEHKNLSISELEH